jgi:threonine dehydrogenase-like Zn-dependent dehydrogenase
LVIADLHWQAFKWSGARLEIAISSQVNVAIIGAGIVGLATGLELTSRFPGISLAVIDKNLRLQAISLATTAELSTPESTTNQAA